MFNKSRFLIVVIAMALTGCSYNGTINIPGVYRLNVQQGNVLEQHMLDRLRADMDKNQVEFILGTPAFVDPFHTNQWEYFYSYAIEGDNRKQRHLRLHFIDEKLFYIEGDVVVTDRDLTDLVRQSRTVDVPEGRRREGIFKRAFNAIPFIGDDPPRMVESKENEEDSENSSEESTENTEEPEPST
jgi:outer membrane protein assembly factor BamE